MEFNKGLKDNITQESIAYGYTLSVWGSGAMLLNAFSTTPEDILAFVTGGVIGFGILAAMAFRSLIKDVKTTGEREFVVASAIHLVASFGTVVLNYALIQYVGLTQMSIFFIAGLNATLLYNLMLVAEEYISEDLYLFEESLHQQP